MSLRVAILGARGIGFFHARIFNELGHQVCGLLGSSNETADKAANKLYEAYGLNAAPFSNLDNLLNEINPDILSICTPPEFHLEQLIKVLDFEKSVFCEKPIFWHSGIKYREVINGIKRLEEYPQLILHVNTSNASFIESIEDRIPSINQIKSFTFEFNTNGVHTGIEIAADLLPHGISMLLELFGLEKISSIRDEVSKNSYNCKFYYGDCLVEFKFLVGAEIRKKLLFSINKHQFLRVQEKIGLTQFKVALKDLESGEIIKVEDPFKIYIKKFLKYYHAKDDINQKVTKTALNNIRLMADIIFK